MTAQTPLASQLKVLNVLWGALTTAVIAYAGVCFVVARSGGAADPETIRVLARMLVLAALAAGVVSVWWRRSFATSPSSPLFLFVGESPQGPPPEEAVGIALQRLQANCIIVWAMSEAVALFGVVLCVLNRDFPSYLPFGIGALILFRLHRPGVWPITRILGHAGVPS